MLGESGYARKALDGYWTPEFATKWLLDAGHFDPVEGEVVWEPACGVGHISKVLAAHGFDVLSTDVVNHGWDGQAGIQDFLSIEKVDPKVRLIFTNPPYDIEGVPGIPDVTAQQFIEHALKLMYPVKGCVVMLLRNEYDCAKSRRHLFSGYPYRGKFILSKRPRWIEESAMKIDPKTGKPKKTGPRHNYSWFVWDWNSHSIAPNVEVLPIWSNSLSKKLQLEAA